eukprot:TRINITY_DN7925_c0_g2_i2.p1 TRINITY_DN7925_c0_g2~~TRINITY_DN7925_c0_g2_i2.p1  ORF type:complete len:354 (-),score=115.62 TRINITY_DN7925_c0_g2_i2:141-1202(-)
MPAVIYRIEQLFPDLREDCTDENILLQTIRVPKKLLSLTNRLPKPNYNMKEDEKHNRHTTIGSYLPDIGARKRSQYKPYLDSKQNLKKLFGDRSRLNVSKANNSKLKALDRTPPKNLHGESQSKNPQDDLFVEGSVKESEKREESAEKKLGEYDLNFVDDSKTNESALSPTRKPIRDKNLNRKSNAHSNDAANQDILQLIRNKYIRRVQRGKQIDPAGSVNKSDLYDYSGASIANSYIRQIVNRRNPVVKPINYNAQMLANIYSDNPQQLSLVARRLQSIKRPRMLLKQGDHSFSPLQRELKGLLRPRPEGHKSKDATSKSRLEPIKLINCNKDLQAIGIKPQPVLSNIQYKN